MDVPRFLTFLASICLVGAANWSSLSVVASLVLSDQRYGHYSHILLIPFLSAYLVYFRRGTVFKDPTWEPIRGLSLAGLAVALSLLLPKGDGRQIDSLIPALSFTVIECWGVFIWCYGSAAFRQGLFGMAFLMGIVPAPSLLMDSIIGGLQLATAEAVDALFTIIGIPVHREGIVFHLTNLAVEIAPECSGIRSSLSLFICSLVAGHIFLRRIVMRSILVISVIPLTIIKNAMRIVLLSIMGNYLDARYLTESSLHNRGGIPLFFLSLGVLLTILWWLRLQENNSARPLALSQSARVA